MCACICRSTYSNKKNDWRSEGRTGGETHLEFRSTDHKPLSENPHDSDPFFLETAAQKLSEIQLAQRSAFERSETEAQVFEGMRLVVTHQRKSYIVHMHILYPGSLGNVGYVEW